MSDDYLYCDKHLDAWFPDCPRCEECSRHHYGVGVLGAFTGGHVKMLIQEEDGSWRDLIAKSIEGMTEDEVFVMLTTSGHGSDV